MAEKYGPKMYQIGAFAHHMGVTPDFLKHYEQFRLVESVPSKSGYRYYPFSQAYKILNCMSMRGYGLPLKEIDVLLNDQDLPAIKEKLDVRAEELRQELIFQQAVLDDHQCLSAWMERMLTRGYDWRVETQDSYYFLPHTYQKDFLADERIYDILKLWMHWMPVVKSCLEMPRLPSDLLHCSPDKQEYFWGLLIPQSLAQKYGLPINGAVRTIPRRKWFLFDFAVSTPASNTAHFLFPMRALQEQLARLGLTPSGNIYKVILFHAHINGPELLHCGCFMVPIE